MKHAFLLAVVLAACGSQTASPPPRQSEVPPGTEYTLGFGPVTVLPGEEQTKCVIKRLGNDKKLYVGSIRNHLEGGSHHLIVYRSTATEEELTPTDCVPFTDTLDPSKGSTLVVTQKKEDTLSLPEGVAFLLEPNQMIRLEMHYINPGNAPAEVRATSTFVTMDDTKFQHEADFLFIGNPDIRLPARQKSTLGPTFFQLPLEYEGAKFFSITGHQHKLGTNVKVYAASSAEDNPGRPVYDVKDWLWSEPKTEVLDPPLTVPIDGGGFRFTCDWNNTTDKVVRFGESANDEMCFFWAYYYPSQGSKVCLHTSQVNGGIDICCPGPSLYCAVILDRLRNGL